MRRSNNHKCSAVGKFFCNYDRLEEGAMGSGLRIVLVALALTAAGPPPNPAVGTWKLNVAKSRFDPGPGWRSQIRVYRRTPAGMSVTWSGIGGRGERMRVSFTVPYDGSDAPMVGSANYDTLNSVKVDALTVKSEEKRAGKVVGTAIRKLSPDGKVMTITDKGTTRSGKKFSQLLVFDRQ
jgi:hypothetical protein